MRIYAVADIHADPERIKRVRRIVSSYKPDVLVVAGDIINYFYPKKTLIQLSNLAIPVFVVRGNSDPGYVDKYFKRYGNIIDLHLKRVTVESIPFTGMSGTIPLPFRNQVGFREKDLMDKASPLIDSQTIFVAHTPPWGILDHVMGRFHSGSKMLRKLVEQNQPRLLICGHIHEAAGIAKIGETLVVNCSLPRAGQGVMIELGDLHKVTAKML